MNEHCFDGSNLYLAIKTQVNMVKTWANDKKRDGNDSVPIKTHDYRDTVT